VFGRVRDEICSSFERAEASVREASGHSRPPNLVLALAEFELHGASLRSLARWYPDESRVRKAVLDWEFLASRLAANGLPVDALLFLHDRPT
jgi:hypothetical protein